MKSTGEKEIPPTGHVTGNKGLVVTSMRLRRNRMKKKNGAVSEMREKEKSRFAGRNGPIKRAGGGGAQVEAHTLYKEVGRQGRGEIERK